MFPSSVAARSFQQDVAWPLLVCGAFALAGCQSLQAPEAGQPLGPRLDESIRVLAAPESGARERAQEEVVYRRLTAAQLPRLLSDAAKPGLSPLGAPSTAVQSPARFADIDPVVGPRLSRPGLHRFGLGLPAVGRLRPAGDPNAPKTGYRVPLTLVALPKSPSTECCNAALVDPRQIQTTRTTHGDVPVAMDLETPLSESAAAGRRFGAGLANLVRPGHFTGQPRIVFLEPFDPKKTPVVLIHGLLSTPRTWEPLVMDLMADPEIRARCQFWFFYYPTGQPVPLSALQLRNALDDAVIAHKVNKPMILLGHSMGGILARAQVSRITEREAESIVPGVASLPETSRVRRALIFEPRTDVSRVVFLFTPHRGSRWATSGLGAWGIRLIRLPDTLLNELSDAVDQITGVEIERLPTSIHGLSPNSRFLRALDSTKPAVPSHTILGDRGRGTLETSSDGVVPYHSAHLPVAESERVVPTGHSGFDHPASVKELRRIIHEALDAERDGGTERHVSRPYRND